MTDRTKRINELAKKAREVGLTEEEKAEQATLRQEWLAAFRQNMISQLDNTYIVDEEGNEKPIRMKED